MTYNLAVNLPLRGPVRPRLQRTLASMDVDDALLLYPDPAGEVAVREATAAWMDQHLGGTRSAASRIVLTGGARHALWLALEHVGIRDAPVLVEALTFPGLLELVRAQGGHAVAVAMDQDGLRPDALEDAVKQSGARVLYVQPTLHNPTTATMPLDRRRDVASVARRLGLTLIEGDVYGPYAWQDTTPLPALASLLPERTVLAAGMGKILGPGLRYGWLALPDDTAAAAVRERIRLTQDGLPALTSRLVGTWMADGTAARVLAEQASAMTTRHGLARKWLGDAVIAAEGLHAWLPATDAGALAEALARRGVQVTPPGAACVVPEPPPGIRLCLGAEEDLERLGDALRHVARARDELRAWPR
jgi:DNA-binding transcriptional MocR family regulator